MNLDMIRRRHKWLTLIILFVISVAFIFGIGSFVTGDFMAGPGGPTGSAAEVNGEDISVRQYILEREIMRRQFGQGQELPQAAIDIINQRALEQLVDYKLLAQKAKDLGFVVTDEEFISAIHSDPSFQIDGQFMGAEGYRRFIEQGLNQNLPDFENYYKEKMLAQKLARLIGETVVITDEKLLNIYNIQNETVNLEYIEVTPDDIANIEEPSEEEIAKYYEQNKSNFKTDELRKIRYVVVDPSNFENKVEISEEEINAYYNAYPEEFQSEEGELIPFDEAKTDVEAKLKSQRAEAVRDEFVQSYQSTESSIDNLDQFAKENSIDTINESEAFGRAERLEDVPPQIVIRTFTEEKGNVSIVPMGTSIWVLEVSEIIEPKDKSLEEIKPNIVTTLKNQKAKNQARKKANSLLAELRSLKKDEISTKAQESGVTIKETGPFTRTENVPVINLEQVKNEAFNADAETVVFEKVYENNNGYYVVIFKERTKANPDDFELEKAALEEQELQIERNNLLQKWIQDLRREAKIERNEELFPSQG